MSLTTEDLAQIQTLMIDVVTDAIKTLVIPRFDEHDRRFDEQDKRFEALEANMAAVKDDVRILKEDVRILKSDMREVKDRLGRVEGRLEAVEADIKELYAMVAAQKPTYADKKFAKRSVEQKVLQMYEDVKLLAREAGVTLPR